MVVGLILIIIENPKGVPQPLPLDLKNTPEPAKMDRKEATHFAAKRLARFLEEGKALLEIDADAKLIGNWEVRTMAFIRTAYGEEESLRFFDDTARSHTLHDLVQLRNSRILELVRRLEFTKVREDFDPDMQMDY